MERLSTEEYTAVLQEWQETRDPKLTARVMRSMYYFVVKQARDMTRTRTRFLDDAIQVGSIGVLLAMNRWNPERSNGASFPTYARFWIRAEIGRLLKTESNGAIRVPEYSQNLVKKKEAAGDLPVGTLSQLKVLYWDAPDAARPWSSIREANALELGQSYCEDLTATIGDHQRAELLYSYLLRLVPRERLVVSSILRGETMVDIGRRVGVSRERIRQIREEATVRMRAWFREHQAQQRSAYV